METLTEYEILIKGDYTWEDVPSLYRAIARFGRKIELTKEDSDRKRAKQNKREYKKLIKETWELIEVLEKEHGGMF
ncbi:hypothetical protein CMI37_32950 [Candidatus Pacearchaeota archaeon]|nr:hypothetical protein [Candidatus Pacearchaeota archaeon]